MPVRSLSLISPRLRGECPAKPDKGGSGFEKSPFRFASLSTSPVNGGG